MSEAFDSAWEAAAIRRNVDMAFEGARHAEAVAQIIARFANSIAEAMHETRNPQPGEGNEGA